MRHLLSPLMAVVAGLVLAGCGSASGPGSAGDLTPLSAIKGYQAIPDRPLGPATQSITQYDGSSWSFTAPASGRVTLVYFGYTSCPDVCPLTMSALAVAVHHLPPDLRDKVWVQFVSTDPHRDTPAQLRRWITAYSPTFHAGRAPISRVIAAARSYGISISPPKITRGDYQVTHGAQVLVLDPSGGEVGFFAVLSGVKSYEQALPTLIERYA